MRGPNTPAEYAQVAAACARMMRAVDPSIVLVSSGVWSQEEWYTTVLGGIGDCFEHVSHHEYTAVMKAFGGTRGRQELRRLASAGALALHGLEELRGLMRRRPHISSRPPGRGGGGCDTADA